MATYEDLRNITGSPGGSALRAKIEVAITIKAQTLIDGVPTAGQLAWAAEALQSPPSKAPQVMNYMIAANNAAALSAITGAADTVIQTNTNAAVDALVV
jgi:hypothetical protein